MVVAAATVLCALLAIPAETIGTRFGGIPAALPHLTIPHIPIERTRELFPSAFTIAFLAGVESLLSAVVADGMIGGRHRSNCELVAQGAANVVSALFSGLPATGALARTATNVRAGARSPLAGMLHAVFLLLFMLALAPWLRYVPLASLAAVLVVVAWNMADVESFRHLMQGPLGDRAVLLLTFALTVMFDLTVAIEVGLVLASFLFMQSMTGVVALKSDRRVLDDDIDDFAAPSPGSQRTGLPSDVEVFRVSGPLFFAVANRLDEVLNLFPRPPRVFILRLRLVPLIDASGVTSLRQLVKRCRHAGRSPRVRVFESAKAQHLAAGDIENRHQVHEAVGHRQVRYIACPHLIRPLDRKARQKIRDRSSHRVPECWCAARRYSASMPIRRISVATCRRPTSWPSRRNAAASLREP